MKFSGRATVVQASVLGQIVNLTLSDTGFHEWGSNGGKASAKLAVINVPTLLHAELLVARTRAGVNGGLANNKARSDAYLANITLSVLGLVTVNADLIEAHSRATCSNAGNARVKGWSKIVDLKVNGILKADVEVTTAPNQVLLNLLGIKLISNEQKESGNGGDFREITVSALHLDAGLLAQVYVSRAHSDIKCANHS
ncbi:MAG: choice-of-anchor P family protein [Actinomycetota bacterium]